LFLLDSLMISGIQWALKTVVAAAEAEMNDDSALRDRLLEAELQREMGEISDGEFAEIEADLLQAIREIRERRDGGSGAFAFGAGQPMETGEHGQFQIQAEVAGDFYGDTDRSDRSGRSDRSNTPAGAPATARTGRSARTPRTARTSRTPRTARTSRTARTK
jgi:hypothetical protein